MKISSQQRTDPRHSHTITRNFTELKGSTNWIHLNRGDPEKILWLDDLKHLIDSHALKSPLHTGRPIHLYRIYESR
ncbi:hypothetical protein VDG1235_2175 [Verrucomicrobiia bacterium DG1235]|nr:hypothetical protein VDG1235_2175 [Verrucomicrobiae bacterium DG1235]